MWDRSTVSHLLTTRSGILLDIKFHFHCTEQYCQLNNPISAQLEVDVKTALPIVHTGRYLICGTPAQKPLELGAPNRLPSPDPQGPHGFHPATDRACQSHRPGFQEQTVFHVKSHGQFIDNLNLQ